MILPSTFNDYNDWITTDVGDGLGNAAAVLANSNRLPAPAPVLPADRNALLDMQALHLHLCGPGQYDLLPALPPGTESFQCELAPSGHLVLPCSEYAGVDREEAGSLDTGADIAPLSNTANQGA